MQQWLQTQDVPPDTGANVLRELMQQPQANVLRELLMLRNLGNAES